MQNTEPLEIQILIADDHLLFRAGLRSLIESIDHLHLIAEASTSQEAVEKTIELQPDIVLMDIQMPGQNGIEATRQITRLAPHVGVIICTMFEDDDSVFAAMRAGARGYVLKGSDQADVTQAIYAVVRGDSLLSPAIARRVMSYFAQQLDFSTTQVFPELTDRERELLGLLAQGLGNAEIARRLVISNKTVRNHVYNIMQKLHVADRTQAIMRARQAGL